VLSIDHIAQNLEASDPASEYAYEHPNRLFSSNGLIFPARLSNLAKRVACDKGKDRRFAALSNSLS